MYVEHNTSPVEFNWSIFIFYSFFLEEFIEDQCLIINLIEKRISWFCPVCNVHVCIVHFSIYLFLFLVKVKVNHYIAPFSLSICFSRIIFGLDCVVDLHKVKKGSILVTRLLICYWSYWKDQEIDPGIYSGHPPFTGEILNISTQHHLCFHQKTRF